MKLFLSLFFSGAICYFSNCKPTYKDDDSHLLWLDRLKLTNLKNINDTLKHLVPLLDSVIRDDQKYRSRTDPGLYKRNQKKQTELDKINIEKITAILDRYGWLGVKDVGYLGASAINMVMIHCAVDTKKKYYHKIIDAFRAGKLFSESVAMYEDKMNLMLRRRQYYGTQMAQFKGQYILYPVMDLIKLDTIRKEIGLMPINFYMKQFPKADLDMTVYEQHLKEITSIFKVNDSIPIHTDLKIIIDSVRQVKAAMRDSLAAAH